MFVTTHDFERCPAVMIFQDADIVVYQSKRGLCVSEKIVADLKTNKEPRSAV